MKTVLAYSADQHQMLDPPKRAILDAKSDDRIRSFASDTGQVFEFVGRGDVYVY